MSSNIRIKKVCQYCGAEYVAKTTVTKHCSDNCAKRAYKARKRDEKVARVKSVDEQTFEHKLELSGNKEFLSIAETASLLGASRMTIYRQIKAGSLHAAKLGRRTIIRRSDIEKLFDK